MITRLRHSQQATAAIEAAVVFPAVLVLIMLIVYAGRLSQAAADVRLAATAAARAASLAQHPAPAEAAADQTATEDLQAAGAACRDVDVRLEADLAPGGQATAQVVCTTDLSDLGLLGVPGSQTVAAQATAPVDRYREASP